MCGWMHNFCGFLITKDDPSDIPCQHIVSLMRALSKKLLYDDNLIAMWRTDIQYARVREESVQDLQDPAAELKIARSCVFSEILHRQIPHS